MAACEKTVHLDNERVKLFLKETVNELSSLLKKVSILDKDESLQAKTDKYEETVINVQRALDCCEMKVLFIGRPRSGKSTLINAILGEKIIPTSPLQATPCFIHVVGTSDCQPKIVGAVHDVFNIADALRTPQLEGDDVVWLHYPNTKCSLLGKDVILIDTPGFDTSTDINQWIARKCVDSNVIILVVNSMETITHTEKKFLVQVCQKSLPCRVFIVYNRWDQVTEESMDSNVVRNQHVSQAQKLLKNELCIPADQVLESIFFLSATMVLKRNGENMRKFECFNECLMDFLRRTQMNTKLKTPYETISKTVNSFMESLDLGIFEINDQKGKLKVEIKHRMSNFEQFKENFECFQKQYVSINMIKKMASEAWVGELQKLSDYISEFHCSHDIHNESGLRQYNHALYEHVKKRMKESLDHVLLKKVSGLIHSKLTLALTEATAGLMHMKNSQPGESVDVYMVYEMPSCSDFLVEFKDNLRFEVPESAFSEIVSHVMGILNHVNGFPSARHLLQPVSQYAYLVPIIVKLGYDGYHAIKWFVNGKEAKIKDNFLKYSTEKLSEITESFSNNFVRDIDQQLNQFCLQIMAKAKTYLHIDKIIRDLMMLEQKEKSYRQLHEEFLKIKTKLKEFNETFMLPYIL